MSEFIEGFDKLAQVQLTVSIFGSARVEPGSVYYNAAQSIASLLASEGYTIITGGRVWHHGGSQQGCLDQKPHVHRTEHQIACRTETQLYRNIHPCPSSTL